MINENSERKSYRMNSIIYLDEDYGRTEILTDKISEIINNPEDKFESALFLTIGENRKGQGGLRTKGYFKKSFEDKPLISIITVVYNGGKYLEETIQSVINQTYDNVEYIIIDGGSTDGTLDIIKKYEDRIDYWVSEKDKGIYDAMNKGWSLINEDSRILFLGAGDKVLTFPALKELINHKHAIIYGNVYIGKNLFYSKVNWKLKLGNTIHHQALLVPKIINKQPPFDNSFSIYADYDFNLRLYIGNHLFVKSSYFTSYALPDGVSARIDLIQIFDISKKNVGYFYGLLSILYISIQKIKIYFRSKN